MLPRLLFFFYLQQSCDSMSILPAANDEMISYKSHIMTSSTYTLSISLPTLILHIPSKTFLETLYNRFSTDLALWKPASPDDMERATARSMFYSSMDMLQPAVTRDEKFKLCKSVFKEGKNHFMTQL